MLKVMIVDDEKKICQLINCLVDWKSLDLEVVGMAHSGSSALALAKELSPDIMITDIRMPNIDGIELVNQLKKTNANVKFIIISGYQYFEYAREAMKLGINDYLLKPIDKDELIFSLKKLINEIQQAKDEKETKNNLVQILAENEEKNFEDYIDSVLSPSSTNENKTNDFMFKNEFLSAIKIKIDTNTTNFSNCSIIIKMINEKLINEINSESIRLHFRYKDFAELIVLNTSFNDDLKLNKVYKSIFDICEKITAKFDNQFITIGVSDVFDSQTQISKALKQANSAIDYRIKVGTRKIIYFSKYVFSNTTLNSIRSIGTINKMTAFLEACDKNSAIMGVYHLENNIISIENYSPTLLFEGLAEVVELIGIYYKKINEPEDEIAKKIAKFNLILNAYYTEKSIYFNFTTELGNQIDELMNKRAQQTPNAIRLARRYVQEHYQEQISLSDVAAATNLNASYLSACFKKELGINYSDFLTECRINAAKQLLQSSQLTIATIAEQIGYTDPKYFSKLFQKTVGLKPSAFRKLYS